MSNVITVQCVTAQPGWSDENPFFSCLDSAPLLKHNPNISAGSTILLMFSHDSPSRPILSQRDALVLILQNKYLRHGDLRQVTFRVCGAEQTTKIRSLSIQTTSYLSSFVQA